MYGPERIGKNTRLRRPSHRKANAATETRSQCRKGWIRTGVSPRGPRSGGQRAASRARFRLRRQARYVAVARFLTSATAAPSTAESPARRVGASTGPTATAISSTAAGDATRGPGQLHTLVKRSITVATRGSVHRSVPNPRLGAHRRNAASKSAGCCASTRGLRPARPALFSPAWPPAFHARYHRPTGRHRRHLQRARHHGLRLPCTSKRAARTRRAFNAARSRRAPRRVGISQHRTRWFS